MNSDFVKDFEIVKKHLILLCTEWQFYQKMYTNDESLYVLNYSASFFFQRMQIILIDSMILKIAKLLEKRETGRNGNNKNLTIHYLIDELQLNDIKQLSRLAYAVDFRDGKFLYQVFTLERGSFTGNYLKVNYWFKEKPTFNVRYEDLKDNFDKIKDYRNKVLAHIDQPTNQERINHFPNDALAILKTIINNLAILMNEIEVLLKNTSTAYQDIIMYNGTDSLLMNLMRGKRYVELVDEGKIDNLDFLHNENKLKGIES